MAEILIQRKRRRSVWPWLLGLLVLALLPLPFLNDRGEQRPVARAAPRRDTTTNVVASTRDSGASQIPGASVAAASPGASLGATQGASAGASAGPASRAALSPRQPSTGGVAAAPGAEAQRAVVERTTATSAGTIAPAETAPAAAPPTRRAADSSPPSGNSFSRFTATTRAPTNERAHRDYAADALQRLATELRVLGATEQGVAVITAYADSLQMANARSAARPDYARAAFLGAVHQFDLLRARNRGRVNIARLRSAAWAIDPRRPLVAQRATVERFFAAARDALDSLSRRS